MKIFYDTEFLEDGKTIDLISIGMVAEDGRELYLVSEEINADPLGERLRSHNWLMENVVVHLPLKTRHDGTPWIDMPGPANTFPRRLGHFALDLDDNRIASLRHIRNAVREFIQATPDAELWAWYGAYDHVALAQLFGPMSQMPSWIPFWTHDLMQLAEQAGLDGSKLKDHVPQLEGAHDALADARWNQQAWAYLDAHGSTLRLPGLAESGRRFGKTAASAGRCPTCGSRDPRFHPAFSGGGEVAQICPDAFHGGA